MATDTACGISVLWSGIESGPSAVTAWNPNHWTAREFPISNNFFGQKSTIYKVKGQTGGKTLSTQSQRSNFT